MSDPAPDLTAIAAGLRAAFPTLGPRAPLRLLGVGFGSVVVETPGGVVFRIARHRAAAEGHAREARLLPALRQRVPLPVPDPRWSVRPSATFAHGAIGYPKLPGQPLTPERLARGASDEIASDLARFLADLHSFSTADAEALGVPNDDRRWEAIAARRDRSLPILRQTLDRTEYARVAEWWDDFLSDQTMREYAPALCHGDFWHENVLVDEAARRVAGVLDFESAEIGDPAEDFATLLYLGERFAAAVLTAYESAGGTVDAGFRYRVSRLWALREARVPDDPAELEDQIRKLRASPILAGRG